LNFCIVSISAEKNIMSRCKRAQKTHFRFVLHFASGKLVLAGAKAHLWLQSVQFKHVRPVTREPIELVDHGRDIAVAVAAQPNQRAVL
jgi:hypothetical protein